MKLNQIHKIQGWRKKPKRVGRGIGSGHGKTSCRGQKGQTSRSGRATRPGFEGGQTPLIKRIPKRGFTKYPKTIYQVVNLDKLNTLTDGTEVDLKVMVEKGWIKKGPVKILGGGTLEKRVIVKADAFSESAKNKIEGKGGKAQRLGSAEERKNGSAEAGRHKG
jgi:large subunit ribosomal protein L15